MSCHEIEPAIVDLARGVTGDQDARLARHVLWCPSCAGRLEQERAMSGALRRLAGDLEEPAADPSRELALLETFDREMVRPRSRAHAPAWTWLAAAGMAFAAALSWHLAGAPNRPGSGTPPVAGLTEGTRQAPPLDAPSLVTDVEPALSSSVRSREAEHAGIRSDQPADSAEFVVWPGAEAGPRFESGALIRVDIPTEAGVVQAEVLVGQDGFARAIRLVQ